MRGELIYALDGEMTGVTDFGVALDAILSGATPIPAQGARFDVGFEGRLTGGDCGLHPGRRPCLCAAGRSL